MGVFQCLGPSVFNGFQRDVAALGLLTFVYLYVMHFVQGSMAVTDLSNKKNKRAPRVLCLFALGKKA